MRVLTPKLRAKLKFPLGILIQGSFQETMRELGKLVKTETPPRIISVGDAVSNNMIRHNLLPHVLVVDNKVMRAPINPIHMDVSQTLHVKNPPGTITDEAWSVLEKAINQTQRTRVLVEGEEDLLALIAVLCAPEGSFIVYGQPHEGIVVVKVTKEKQKTIQKLVDEMTIEDQKSKSKKAIAIPTERDENE